MSLLESVWRIEGGQIPQIRVRETDAEREPDPHRNGREGFREGGEGVTGGSQDERRPNPTKGTRPPLPTDREGFRWI